MTDKVREEYRQEAERGRRWAVALEVLREFCDKRREGLTRDIEGHGYENPHELLTMAAALETLAQFRRLAEDYINQGKSSGRVLSEFGEA